MGTTSNQGRNSKCRSTYLTETQELLMNQSRRVKGGRDSWIEEHATALQYLAGWNKK